MVAALIGIGTREADVQARSSSRPSTLMAPSARGTTSVGGSTSPPVSAV